jgi:hypothetical protein
VGAFDEKKQKSKISCKCTFKWVATVATKEDKYGGHLQVHIKVPPAMLLLHYLQLLLVAILAVSSSALLAFFLIFCSASEAAVEVWK